MVWFPDEGNPIGSLGETLLMGCLDAKATLGCASKRVPVTIHVSSNGIRGTITPCDSISWNCFSAVLSGEYGRISPAFVPMSTRRIPLKSRCINSEWDPDLHVGIPYEPDNKIS